jgi:hypothetical protein
MPSQRPSGFHVEHLDTGLLQQIIQTDIDCAIHTILRESGERIDDATRHQWEAAVLLSVKEEVCTAASLHQLLPAEIDRCITVEIDRLIEDYRKRDVATDCGSIIVPIHGIFHLHRHALVLCRKLFEKRLE